MSEPIIELKSVTKKYGDFTAVDRLTLTINRGEVFGLLGPNGAGKSTTILMMLGLTEPYSGSVQVCGIDSTRQPIQVKRRVGYLPDDVGFYEDLSGLENLIFTAKLNRIPESEARSKALELLERVGLKDDAEKRAGAYSRGMRQRLGLADVLIKDPEVIILDEPTLGIDPKGVSELLELIRRLSTELHITVLLSSHHLHQVQEICDRVGLFVKGKLVAVGTVAELSESLFKDEPISIELSAAPVTDKLLDELHALDGVIRLHSDAENIRLQCKHDISGKLAKCVIDSGAELHSLHKKSYGLDEIYHRYFEGGESHA
ncbi:ABC transporter ATP-binding protein [Paenibacillus thermotolerans]|uniref:ABC transporter ATP-binding protein n=1 Tax=Paenibacillus thermotolerans TaxID=3027807 RepID=UPI0023674B5A|nr:MULTISPECIES: ABC transporter ATP-binding protein [unclassified Paenibacillus]